MGIPKQEKIQNKKINPNNIDETKVEREKILFSFGSIERNEYFNLDGTCANWASDLFDTMKIVSEINIKDVYAGKYSGKNTTLRIHNHDHAKPPCEVPSNIELDNLWQIRISVSKGGIHGIFVGNIFYVLWFDPHHNLYPDKNHGGLTRVKPPSTCCKDRDEEISNLKHRLEEKESEIIQLQQDLDEVLAE